MGQSATLQINLAPSDWRLAFEILPHQLRQWKNQFQEILLVLDGHRSRGRFAENWDSGREKIVSLLEQIVHSTPHARWIWVDYSNKTQYLISQEFFNKGICPRKDWRGGPFYAYFFGLFQAQNEWVFHCDSDILFGGGSPTWLNEAISLMQAHPCVAFCSPLPGPPGTPRKLRTQPDVKVWDDTDHAFEFSGMSTRLFLTRKSILQRLKSALIPHRPDLRSSLKAFLKGNPPAELPEILISQAMRSLGLIRVDFLGSSPGMWSLHPPFRSDAFYKHLPDIIKRVESGDIPEDQCGDYDLNDSMIDWSSAREQLASKSWRKKILPWR